MDRCACTGGAPVTAAWSDRLGAPRERTGTRTTAPAPSVTSGASPYGVAALTREADAVRALPEGTRAKGLYESAYRIGRLVAGGEILEREARAALSAAGRACGLGDHEIAHAIESGITRGAGDPRRAPPRAERTNLPDRNGHYVSESDPGEPPEWLNEGDDETKPDAARPASRAVSIADVLAKWSKDGPLIHEPTGIQRLDELTGGGPVYGTRWYFPGAPDAGKTGLTLQLAHTYAQRGVTVGLLAVDEEPGDLVTRLAQRLGYMRVDCEIRDPSTLADIGDALSGLPLRFYDSSWEIETAAADLAAYARQRAEAEPGSHPHGPRAVLGIDSLQTVKCAAESIAAMNGRELSEVAAVTARVHAIRTVATRHKLIALCTSELGRGAYSQRDPDKQTATLAASKWSGAVEYSARVLIGVRSVADEKDLVELELAKNKHGPRDEKVYLRIDRRSQTFAEVAYEPPPAATTAGKDERAQGQVVRDAAVVARALLATPNMGTRELRAACRASSGIGHDRVDAGLAALRTAVVKGKGPRGATPMTLDAGLIPAEIRTAMEGS